MTITSVCDVTNDILLNDAFYFAVNLMNEWGLKSIVSIDYNINMSMSFLI